MKYALLIYSPNENGPPDAEKAAAHPLWMSLTKDLRESGDHRAGDALQSVETATTLRVRDGQRLLTDGPFAETKEGLAGFYVIDVENLDAAIEWAARVPLIEYGSVEVRPIMDVGAAA